MGLRQPSKTAAFFAQAEAGAQQQQKAREQMKKPQALGGSAAAGTQMIAASTGAQQQATEQVQKTGQEAAGTLKVDETKLPSSTEMAITGTATTTPGVSKPAVAPTGLPPPPGAAPVSSTMETLKELQDQLSKTSSLSPNFNKLMGQITKIKSDLGLVDATNGTNDVSAIMTAGENINNAINSVTAEIKNLDDKITTATTEDRKKLSDEKTRLEALLKTYQDKLTKENLGQIAGPSDVEQQLAEREQLLASEEKRVAKLASIFGPGWNAKRYGALSSQIYGKDLENIQEAASSGLEKAKAAQSQAGAAEEAYTRQLKTGKEGYEKSLDTEGKKLDLLTKTPQELAGYTKDEIVNLFGADKADKLFKFDKDNKIIGTKLSATKDALTDRLTYLNKEKEKLPDVLSKAQTIETKNLGETKNLVTNIINDLGTQSGWLGERGMAVFTPIQDNINKLLTDFSENSKNYTPKERSAALSTLKVKLNNEKTNMANQLAAFLLDTNTNSYTAKSAYEYLQKYNLIPLLSRDAAKKVEDRRIAEAISLNDFGWNPTISGNFQ